MVRNIWVMMLGYSGGKHAFLVLEKTIQRRRRRAQHCVCGCGWVFVCSQLTCVWPLTFPPQSTCCQRRSRGWQPHPPGSSTSSPGSASCKPLCVCVCVWCLELKQLIVQVDDQQCVTWCLVFSNRVKMSLFSVFLSVMWLEFSDCYLRRKQWINDIIYYDNSSQLSSEDHVPPGST